MKDSRPRYWQEYTNLQLTKHKLIREYLNGWFPKLGSWCGKILYMDTHAGRGKHIRGQKGSPLVAMETFLNHSWRDKILKKCEVKFVFIEFDEANATFLKTELEKIGTPPRGVTYTIYNIDAFDFIKELTGFLESEDRKLPPCFVFVDPYGFKIPCNILRKIKENPRSELLITLIWRELDMAIRQKHPPKETLNSVFGGDSWKDIKSIEDFDTRGEAAVKLLRDNIGARWATYIRMLGDNQKTRYFLVHLTDHEAGRDLMKQVIWKCCPDGGYYVRKRDDPRQQYLIKPGPDPKLLENWLLEKLTIKHYTLRELCNILREEIWLEKHLWKVIKDLRNKGKIRCTDYVGRFSQRSNPTIRLESYNGGTISN